MNQTVILASGGINSTVTACRAAQNGSPHLLFVDFGQPAAQRQQEAVGAVAGQLAVNSTSITLRQVAEIDRMGREQTAEGAGGASERTGRATIQLSKVPGLKMALVQTALHLAHRLGAESIQTGDSQTADEIETESSPGKGTPDRSREFFYLCSLLLERLQPGKVRVTLHAPLMDLTRAQIVKLGQRFDTPFNLTHACDVQRGVACGSCPSCVAGSRAFQAAGVADAPNSVTIS